MPTSRCLLSLTEERSFDFNVNLNFNINLNFNANLNANLNFNNNFNTIDIR